MHTDEEVSILFFLLPRTHCSCNRSLSKPATPVSPFHMRFRYTGVCLKHQIIPGRKERNHQSWIQCMLWVNASWQKSSTLQGTIDEHHLVVTFGACGSFSCLFWCCSDCICSLLDLVQVLASISQGNRLHQAIQAWFPGTALLSRSAWEQELPPVE